MRCLILDGLVFLFNFCCWDKITPTEKQAEEKRGGGLITLTIPGYTVHYCGEFKDGPTPSHLEYSGEPGEVSIDMLTCWLACTELDFSMLIQFGTLCLVLCFIKIRKDIFGGCAVV